MPVRLTKLSVLAALVLAVTVSGGSAATAVHSPILGVVPHANEPASPLLQAPRAILGLAGPTTLTFDAHYQALIDRYFTDVAHDSGGVENVYSVGTQYYDDPGQVHVQYQSTFGGPFVDHDPLPANGCDDGVDRFCLTDQQLQIEIRAVLAATGWQAGVDHIFFLMTPNGVGACELGGLVANDNPCTTNRFCAYHDSFGQDISDEFTVVYAIEPYMGPLPPGDCTAAGVQGFPNDRDADTTINTISHEQNEAITDPFGDAWVEPGRVEDGDLCAYGFGTQTGGAPGIDAYNQVINGHHYDLQQEFSNVDGGSHGGCVQYLHGPATPPPSGDGSGPLPYGGGRVLHTNTTYAIYWLPTPGNQNAPVVTGPAGVNRTLRTSTGSWNGRPTGYSYQWQRCSSAGTDCVDIAGATASTYKPTVADEHHTLASTVRATNVNGVSTPAASAPTASVVDVPSSTKPPHISGRVRVGRKLSAGHGAWTFSPRSYRFQWLRCNARGTSCSSIHHATHSRYKLTKQDARHRLRVRVTAKNAAGSAAATSAASARVAH
jgi:hypothetical protein